MIDVKAATTYAAVGGLQSLKTTTVTDQTTGVTRVSTLYAGNASTPATSSGTITFDPRDGIFTMKLTDTKANVTRDVRFQDPIHKTDFTGARFPDPSIINLTGYNYLAAQDGDGTTAFFYQRPGTRTFFVTLGGFVHFTASDATTTDRFEERGAFAFGTPTAANQIPRTGTGQFTGDFLAAMTSKNADVSSDPTRMQWINGGSSVLVDFARGSVGFNFAGIVSQAFANGALVADSQLMVPSGSIFNASGTASIDSTYSGFAGRFGSASFTSGGTTTAINLSGINPANSAAGANSIDGTFYGPNAAEVGGSFRIVGAVPDQRFDITGGFTGRK